MAHNFQKRWVFTWNADDLGGLPNRANLIDLLDSIAVKGVFQRERGLKTDRLHYQGRFELKGPRLGKMRLLEIFSQVCETSQLTLDPEILYDSTKYCSKSETRDQGPWFVGTESYKQEMTPMELNLKKWQDQLLEEIEEVDNHQERDRKVFWIEDGPGGSGKSTFTKFLCSSYAKYKAYKLPVDKPDRVRMAVCKIVQKQNIDMFIFDFTRTRGEDTSLNDMYEVIEELKNGHLVSVMYGNPMQVFIKSPHVIIFTNEKFTNHSHKLSQDRWKSYLIQGDELNEFSRDDEVKIGYTPLSKLREIRKLRNNNPGKEENPG